jgi:hypothetical protein
MTFGSRVPYSKPRNEKAMHRNLKESGDFPEWGPTSTARLHRQHLLIQRGNEYNTSRDIRMSREDLLTARLDEERQLSDLTTARRPNLRGAAGNMRSAQRAAAEVFDSMK